MRNLFRTRRRRRAATDLARLMSAIDDLARDAGKAPAPVVSRASLGSLR